MHGALELAAGLAIAVTPIVLGLGTAAVALGIFVGLIMGGLALGAGAPTTERALPVNQHAAYDRLIAVALLAIGVGAGIAANAAGLVFFIAASAVYAVLIAATRYTRAA
jgi:hypothetical protein